MNVVQTLLYKIGATNDEYNQKLDESMTRLERFETRTKTSMTTLRNWGIAAGTAAGAVVYALNRMVQQTDTTSSQIAILSEQTGVAAENLQALGYAAKQNNSDFDTMGRSLQAFTRRIEAAHQGNETYRKSFERMKVSIYDGNGELRTTEEIFLDLADSFSESNDETLKMKTAFDLLGRSGYDIIPTLNLGRAEIVRLANEANRLGIVINSDNIEKFAKYEEQLYRWQEGMKGAKRLLSTAVVPVFELMARKAADGLEATIKWARENPETVRKILILGTAFVGLGLAIGGIVATITLVSKGMMVLRSLFGVLTSPILWLALLAGILYKAWDENWGGIQEKTEKVLGKIQEKIDEFKNWWDNSATAKVLKNLWAEIKDIWDDDTKSFTQKVAETMSAIVKALVIEIGGLVWKWGKKQYNNLADWWNGYTKEILDEDGNIIGTEEHLGMKQKIAVFLDAHLGESEFYKAVKKGFTEGDWSDFWGITHEAWKKGVVLYIALSSIVTGITGALGVLEAIRTGLGLVAATGTAAGLPGILGAISVGLSLLVTKDTGEWGKFGKNLVGALIGGIALGGLTGNPQAGALVFTLMFNLEIGADSLEGIQTIMDWMIHNLQSALTFRWNEIMTLTNFMRQRAEEKFNVKLDSENFEAAMAELEGVTGDELQSRIAQAARTWGIDENILRSQKGFGPLDEDESERRSKENLKFAAAIINSLDASEKEDAISRIAEWQKVDEAALREVTGIKALGEAAEETAAKLQATSFLYEVQPGDSLAALYRDLYGGGQFSDFGEFVKAWTQLNPGLSSQVLIAEDEIQMPAIYAESSFSERETQQIARAYQDMKAHDLENIAATREFFKRGGLEAAQKVADQLGVDPMYLLAQWSEETGYFKSEQAGQDFNFAGLKAAPGQSNKKSYMTPEHRGGKVVTEEHDFLTFEDIDEFADYYVASIRRKWSQAVGASSIDDFIRGLQDPNLYEAGSGFIGAYATNENYLENIKGVLPNVEKYMSYLGLEDIAEKYGFYGKDAVKHFVDGVGAGTIELKPEAESQFVTLMSAWIFDIVANDLEAQGWGYDVVDHFITGLKNAVAAMGQEGEEEFIKLVSRWIHDDPENDAEAAKWGYDFVKWIITGTKAGVEGLGELAAELFDGLGSKMMARFEESFPELAQAIREINFEGTDAISTLEELQRILAEIGEETDDNTEKFLLWAETLSVSFSRAIVSGDGIKGKLKSIRQAFQDFLDQLAQQFLQNKIFNWLSGMILGGDGGGGGLPSFSLGLAGVQAGIKAGTTFHDGGLILNPAAYYHSGGFIGELKSDEVPIIAQTGERVLSRKQNDQFEKMLGTQREAQESFRIDKLEIKAVDSKSFSDMVANNPEAITYVVGNNVINNGVLKKILREISK